MRTIELVAAALFAVAVLHTLSTKVFGRLAYLAYRHPGTRGMFHLLGEVEMVFGFWSLVLVVASRRASSKAAADYMEGRPFTEPWFVFVIMMIAASRPVLVSLRARSHLCAASSRCRALATTWVCLAALPLLGSLMTEPAAMTIAALMLAPRVFRAGIPEWLKYIRARRAVRQRVHWRHAHSFAAPPVVMVAADMELGLGLHGRQLRLEGGGRRAGQRQPGLRAAAKGPGFGPAVPAADDGDGSRSVRSCTSRSWPPWCSPPTTPSCSSGCSCSSWGSRWPMASTSGRC